MSLPILGSVKHGGIVILIQNVDNHLRTGWLSARPSLGGNNLIRVPWLTCSMNTANKDLKLQLSGFLRIKLLVVLDTDDELPALLDDRRRDLRKSYDMDNWMKKVPMSPRRCHCGPAGWAPKHHSDPEVPWMFNLGMWKLSHLLSFSC